MQWACSGRAVGVPCTWKQPPSGAGGRGVPAREPPRAPRRAPPPARGRAAVRRCWVGARVEGGGEGRGVGVEVGVSWAARPLLLVLSEPALGSPLIQDLLACCTPRQDLFAPVGLPLLAPRAHRHAEELLRIGVAEQPCLPAPGAHAVELVGLDSLPRSAGPGVRRLARGARRRARVVVERAGGHRHGLRRTERGAFENGAHREDICVSLSTYGQCTPPRQPRVWEPAGPAVEQSKHQVLHGVRRVRRARDGHQQHRCRACIRASFLQHHGVHEEAVVQPRHRNVDRCA